MAQMEEQNLISWLICKQMIGTITEEEQQVLAEWRKQNKYNEAAYQRLLDTDRQTLEHRRSKLTDYRRPLDDMKRRLGLDESVTEEEIEAAWYDRAQVRELLEKGAFAARTQAYLYMWSKE